MGASGRAYVGQGVVMDERYEDCEICAERFVGQETINAYLEQREFRGEPIMVCVACRDFFGDDLSSLGELDD